MTVELNFPNFPNKKRYKNDNNSSCTRTHYVEIPYGVYVTINAPIKASYIFRPVRNIGSYSFVVGM